MTSKSLGIGTRFFSSRTERFGRGDGAQRLAQVHCRTARLSPVLLGMVLALPLVGCATRRADPTADAARTALGVRYPSVDVLHQGEFRYDKATPLEVVHLPALSKALPDVRFVVTRLSTPYFEYPEVPIAIAVQTHGAAAVCFSPTFSEPDPEFVRVLERAKTENTQSERMVAEEIARLFASITYKGEIRGFHIDVGAVSAELWHGDLHWRHVSITFAGGSIASVTLTHPR